MTRYFFTFGCGSLLRGHYVSLTASNEDNARCAMSDMFREWAECYTIDQFATIKEKRNLEVLLHIELGETE